GLYLAGPALVQAAIGQKVSSEDLGGAKLHATLSGTVDFREPDDEACLERIRGLVGRFGAPPASPFDRGVARSPGRPASDLESVFSAGPQQNYDVRDLLACILDAGAWDEYRPEFGQTLVCGYARLGGFAVGVVANQKKMVRRVAADGAKHLEFGGVIYPESADKAARFIMDCNQSRIPLLFFHDVNGFMVGKEMEAAGIIRSGAKMVNVVANSVVPKFSVILGGSFGAGHYAMCGRAYDPRLLLAWPSARYAVMGGDQAANTLLEIKARQMEKEGHALSPAEREALLADIRARYEGQSDPRYGAARLWLDAIIEPAATRAWLIAGLEAAALNPSLPRSAPACCKPRSAAAMRVLHLVPQLFGRSGIFGGAERYATELATAMSAHAQTRLVGFRPCRNPGAAPPRRQGALEVYRLRNYLLGPRFDVSPAGPTLLPHFLWADVIHCHQIYTLGTSAALLYARATRKPVFLTDHGGGGVSLNTYWKLEAAATARLWVSGLSQRASSVPPRPGDQIIYGGFDPDRFTPAPAAAPPATDVLYVGRVVHEKNLHHLVASVDQVTRVSVL